jgi:L-serine/L-threonine ammonia-lyase
MSSSKLHIDTPLIESTKLSKHLGATVYLKIDAMQPSGSFKIRGIGHACQHYAQKGFKKFIACSGGNAGLAVAYAGRKLGIQVDVIVPSTTGKPIIQRMEAEGAKVQVYGNVFDEANQYAQKLVKEQSDAVYIHPFDDPLLHIGHSTIMEEIYLQLNKKKPDVIITVVGGGGLLAGIIDGCKKVGWSDVPIIASETKGADSFHQSFKVGKLVTLPAITSIAKTLGALTVCEGVFEKAKKHPVMSVVVSDKMAVDACLKFVDDERVLVEPSCGAGIACVYERIPELKKLISGKKDATVVVIVCGGSCATYDALIKWKEALNEEH